MEVNAKNVHNSGLVLQTSDRYIMNTKKDTYKQRNNITEAFAIFSPITLIFPHVSFETFFKTTFVYLLQQW